MNISVEMIKEVREETGAGVLEAKKALEAANGDKVQAVAKLREKGLAKVEKRAERATNEGLIEMYPHPGNRVGVMLELNCETDFVGRNEKFRTLAHELALHIAAMNPKYTTREAVPADVVAKMQEEFSAEALKQGKPAEIVEKIVAGKMGKFFEENVLVEQPFVKDDQVKVQSLITNAVSALGENIVVRRFVRFELGEEL
jgi:elongation factor Ts